MLSLAELRRAASLLDRELAGARLERVFEPEPRHLVFVFRAPERHEVPVLVCAEPELARVNRLPERPRAPRTPDTFVQQLRARLGRAHLESVRIVDQDRQLAFRLTAREGTFDLLLSVLGPRTNVYLLESTGTLLGALRPLGDTRSELRVGDPWRPPASRPPSEGADRFAAIPDARFFAAVEEHYRRLGAERDEAELRRRLRRALRRALESVERKIRHLEEDARGLEEAERCRRHGELLKGALGSLKPGALEVRVRDFESGEEVAIPLDPKLAPAAQLDALFRRARKAERRAVRASQEIGALEGRREALEAWRARAEREGEDLVALASEPEVTRLLERTAPRPPRSRPDGGRPQVVRLAGREVPRRLVPRRYRSSDGLEIWVGRSDEGNDWLSTRLARGNDLFFHVSATPGSHVVLRTEGRTDAPSESVLEAAELAVHASKQRRASRVDVLVAPIKNVRKAKGAKPGLVLVTGGKTVHLRRDPRRLERVLASRIDEEA